MKDYSAVGRHHVIIMQKTQTINPIKIPVIYLLSDNGTSVMWTLVDYFLDNQNKSSSWMRKVARGIGLFYDFSVANRFNNLERDRLGTIFVHAVRHGTINTETGEDRTKLYWAGSTIRVTNEVKRAINSFKEWLDENNKEAQGLSTHTSNDSPEKFTLSLLLTSRKVAAKSMMEHVKNPFDIAAKIEKSRNYLDAPIEHDPSGYFSTEVEHKSFPIELIEPLLEFGFIKNENATDPFEREDITAKMIFILIIYGGLRKGEPFHLWFNDIVPFELDRCRATLHHPSESKTGILGEKNKTRKQYLAERTLLPRNHSNNTKSYKANWKNLAVDKKSLTAEIFFLHISVEALFREMYLLYLKFRSKKIAIFKANHGYDHPFLFISTGKNGEIDYTGAPYSVSQLDKSYKKALDRVEKHLGYRIPRGRESAVNLHSGRHFYANALTDSGVPDKVIQKCLHHRTINAQEAYKNLSTEQIKEKLDKLNIGLPSTNVATKD